MHTGPFSFTTERRSTSHLKNECVFSSSLFSRAMALDTIYILHLGQLCSKGRGMGSWVLLLCIAGLIVPSALLIANEMLGKRSEMPDEERNDDEIPIKFTRLNR